LYIGRVGRPTAGFTAWFIEMTYPNPTGGKHPLKLTTGVRVTPDVLPFAAWKSPDPPPAK
ncbi:MAG: hypothetical protein RIR52_23, partial [Acidobacteriota bacterium]